MGKDNYRQLITKKRIAEKRVSLAIEELKLKREEEKKYQLTQDEQKLYRQLMTIFSDNHPADRIKGAIDDDIRIRDIRKDYLQASKNKHEKEQKKKNIDMNTSGGIMVAAGMPISVIGLILMETFVFPGLTVFATGGCMCVSAIIAALFRRKRTKSELKDANNTLEELEYKIYNITTHIDEICNEFDIPLNDPNRCKYLLPLYQAAQTYEMLLQKEIDYELFLQINRSNILKNTIVEDLKLLTGQVITDENTYSGIIEVLDTKKQKLIVNCNSEELSVATNTKGALQQQHRIC